MSGSTRRPITCQGVIDALDALGLKPKLTHAPTDKDLPQLLGALLAAVETAMTHHVSTDEQWLDVLQGQIRGTGSVPDPRPYLLLAAWRLGRTRSEIAQLMEDSGNPDHPFMALAAEAARAASTATALHLSATDLDRRTTEEEFRLQVDTLQVAVQEVRRRHRRIVEMLPPPT